MHDLGIIIKKNIEEVRKMMLKNSKAVSGFVARLDRMKQRRAYQIFRESRGEIPKAILKTTKF